MLYEMTIEPEHLNSQGILSGSYLLGWIDDQAAATATQWLSGCQVVTVGCHVGFIKPIKDHQTLTLEHRVVHLSKASFTVKSEGRIRSCKKNILICRSYSTLASFSNGKVIPLDKVLLESCRGKISHLKLDAEWHKAAKLKRIRRCLLTG